MFVLVPKEPYDSSSPGEIVNHHLDLGHRGVALRNPFHVLINSHVLVLGFLLDRVVVVNLHRVAHKRQCHADDFRIVIDAATRPVDRDGDSRAEHHSASHIAELLGVSRTSTLRSLTRPA